MAKNWSNYSGYKENIYSANRFDEKTIGITTVENTEIILNNGSDNITKIVQRFKLNKYAKIKIISNSQRKISF